MPTTLAPTNEAIEKFLTWLRGRLEEALRHGQHVEMTAREHAAPRNVSTSVFLRRPLAELVATAEPDGSLDLRIYIEPRK